MGATPSWMVSVLKDEVVGADDASSGNSEKPISPRMMNETEGWSEACLRNWIVKGRLRVIVVKTGGDAVFEKMSVDEVVVMKERRDGRWEREMELEQGGRS